MSANRNPDPLGSKQNLSIKEMAQRLNLSRSRLDQLVEAGVFVAPTRDPRSGRPYFDAEAVAKNVEVRRNGVGIDGRPVLFYSPRVRTLTGGGGRPHHRSRTDGKATSPSRYAEMAAALSALDLGGVTEDEVERALRSLRDQGQHEPDVRAVYRAVKRLRNSSGS